MVKAVLAAVVFAGSIFAGVAGSARAHADEIWLALVVNSNNSQDTTSMFWVTDPDSDKAYAMAQADCRARWKADGTCVQETASRRCIGIALGNGSIHYTAWGDTAAQAYAAAQAKSPIANARGKGRCADGSSTS